MNERSDKFEDKPPEAPELQPFTLREPRRQKTFCDGALQLFRDYCSTSSIHGFAYFSERRTCIEYIWWIVAFILGMCGAIYMINEIYQKWLESPVIVSFATKNIPISDIPFPAVTICPLVKINRTYFNLTAYLRGEYVSKDEETRQRMEKAATYMSLLCASYSPESDVSLIDMEDFLQLMYNETQYFTKNAQVFLDGKEMPFLQVFKETYTEGGLCYTANRLRLDELYRDNVVRNEKHYTDFNASNWDASKGYDPKVNPIEVYPRRASGAGISRGLIVVMAEPANFNDIACSSLLQGYAITLHSPARLARPQEEMLFLPADSAIAVSMTAAVIQTSPKVRQYPPEKRDCYFPAEKPLKFFKVYTIKNCEIECYTNATLDRCGCVAYYMPRENGTPVCGPAKEECLENLRSEMVDDVILRNHGRQYGITGEGGDKRASYACDCLPMCTDIAYRGYIEPMHFAPEFLENLKKAADTETPYQLSVAVLYFKGDRAETTERSELYGPSDFISNFGGLVGLFNGFSILSIVEILYYLTLRILGNIKLYGYWAGPADEPD